MADRAPAAGYGQTAATMSTRSRLVAPILWLLTSAGGAWGAPPALAPAARAARLTPPTARIARSWSPATAGTRASSCGAGTCGALVGVQPCRNLPGRSSWSSAGAASPSTRSRVPRCRLPCDPCSPPPRACPNVVSFRGPPAVALPQLDGRRG